MEIEIERLDDLRRGICYVNNKITFIPNYLVGNLLSKLLA